MATPVVRAGRSEADRVALERILQESFGADDLPWAAWMERLGHENVRVVEQDGALAGGLGFYRFAQHWGGAAVPQVGLAGVGVTPAARGRGVARALLVETLGEARAEGVPLAGLYASSVSVYRSVGFEQAGSVVRWAAPVSSLAAGDVATPCESIGVAELRALRPLYEARARRWNGHLARSEAIWTRIAQPYKGVVRAYRFGPASAPEGYVVHTQTPGESLHFTVSLRDFVLATPAAARRAMALLGGMRSLASELRWLGCATDPLVSLLPEQTARPVEHSRWMLRILDVERALRARGYDADGEARFDVRDALFGDVGVHVRVSGRAAEVTREAPGRAKLALDVRGLAALYTGHAHPTTLHAMGLLDGDLDEAARLARLFAGPEAWLCDWY